MSEDRESFKSSSSRRRDSRVGLWCDGFLALKQRPSELTFKLRLKIIRLACNYNLPVVFDAMSLF